MLMQFKKTEEQLAQKIYPQKNNIPYINPHGQYAVKLKFLGNYYKVIVDDYFPIDIMNRKSLFAKEVNTHNIWPMLITKAILKFYFFKFQQICIQNQKTDSSLLYNGNIVYSLCGMQLMQFKQKQIKGLNWDYFTKVFQNNAAQKLYQIAVLKSQDIKKESVNVKLRGSKFKSIGSTVFFLRKNQKYKKHHDFVDNILCNEKNQKIQVPKGHLFGIQDIFKNENFNMAYVQEVTEKELIIRKKYGQILMQKTQFMSKEDIIELKRKRREFKMTIKEFEKQLLDKMKKKAEHKLLQVSNSIFQDKDIQMQQDYNQKQIQIAKLCKLKNLQKPPNYQNLLDTKIEESSVQTGSNNAKFYKDFGNSTQVLYRNTLSNFDDLEKEQVLQSKKGVWIEYDKLQQQFDNVFVYFNPNAFKNVENILKASDQKSIEMDQNKEILVIYKNDNQDVDMQENICINFQTDSVNMQNFLLLQQYDFNKFEPIKTFDELNLQNQSIKIKTADRNQVFRFTLHSLDNYKISIYSQRSFELMSIGTYLTKIEKWNEKTFNVNIEKINQKIQNYHFKLKIIVQKNQSFIIRNASSDQIKNFLDFQILSKDQNGEKLVDILIDTYANIQLQPGTHILMIKSMTSLNVQNESFDIQLFSQDEFDCYEIPLNKNQLYMDVVRPNKYNQIAKENLFFQKDQLNLSCYFQLKKLQQQSQDELQKNQKKTDQIIADNLEDLQIQIHIQLNIYLENQLVLQLKGVNKIIINDLDLKKDPKQHYTFEYVFQDNQTFDQSLFNNLVWIMNMTPNDNIVLTKNIQKQKENQELIKKWFQNDPKKQSICKIIRQRNILLSKKQKDGLSEEEENNIKNYELQIEQYYNPEQQSKNNKNQQSSHNLIKEEQIDINKFELYNEGLQKLVEDFKCARVIHQSKFGPTKVFSDEDRKQLLDKSIMQKEEIQNLKNQAKDVLIDILKQQEKCIEEQKQNFNTEYDENIDVQLNQIKQDFDNYNRDEKQRQRIREILQGIDIEKNEQIDLTQYEGIDIDQIDYKTQKFIEIINKNAKIKNLENKIEQALQENNQKALKELQSTLEQTDLQIDQNLLTNFENKIQETNKKQLNYKNTKQIYILSQNLFLLINEQT